MGLTRRRLLRSVLVVVATTPVAAWLRKRWPVPTSRALCDLAYPYRVRPLDLAEVRRPAPWGG